MEASTDSLRATAPKWSLAGDDCLLNILQSTHQRIITKCQDVNTKLEQMTSALDDTSINLQNVNNRFMALSNSQFIESRVYDDDEDMSTESQPAKELPQKVIDELSLIKSSLAILERSHETAEILDDSGSDSDTEISVILKPKDMYSHRPLPYIIGTTSWKNKWHAGLIVEDSDTDSTTSKQDEREMEYSDTESDVELPRQRVEDQTISDTSSSLTSSQRIDEPPAQVVQTPADIAAELARRLGGAQAISQERVEHSPPAPAPATRKVYRAEPPAASTIFFDEPPPLEEYVQEDTLSEDDDIFAEINKNKPYTQRSTTQHNLAEDLFSFDKPEVVQGDIFSDFAQQGTRPSKQKSTLFEDEPEPDLFVEAKEVRNNNDKDETNTKKPVGGISLFGTNKGAESIGAAILKRNRRKSSSSGEESGSDVRKEENPVPKNVERSAKSESVPKNRYVDEIDNTSLKKEKDIFDDLFSKPKVSEKKTPQKLVKEPVKEKAKERKDITDLFKENIFDDIDDIFTSDVKIPPKESNQKSIFDDDDDLFSEIATKPKNQATNSKESKKTDEKKRIFDSDDELFSEVKTIDTVKPPAKNIESDKILSKNIESQKGKTVDDQTVNRVSNENRSEISNAKNIVKTTEKTKERNLFDDSPQNVKSDKSIVKSKGIFDSDSDDDIFAGINKTKTEKNALKPDIDKSKHEDNGNAMFKQAANPKLLTTEGRKFEHKSNLLQSPSLFEDDEIEDLSVNTNKSDTSQIVKDTKTAEIKNTPVASKLETIVKDVTITHEIKTSNVDSKRNNDLSKVETSNSNFEEIEPDRAEKTMATKEIDTGTAIFDDNLPDDDIFSTPIYAPKDKDVKRNEQIVTNVIESNQEGDKSKVEEGKNNIETKEQSGETNFDVEPETFDTKEKPEDSNHSIFDDFTDLVNENSPLAVEQKKSFSKEPNIFDDIFSEPPAFEKPSEPKKSKNVNALFDDDSDDESLFFKKNDVISDEKPEIFSSNAHFDIFVSEPPAIDVDFTAKTNKNVVEDDVKSNKNEGVTEDEDIFGSVPTFEENKPKSTEPKLGSYDLNIYEDEDLFSTHEVKQAEAENLDIKKKVTFGKEITDSDDELFSSLPKPNIPETSQENEENHLETNLENSCEIDNIFHDEKEITHSQTKSLADVTEDEFDDMFKNKSSKKENEKKIGKINTKIFNINVNALIPGASPKKLPKVTHIPQESEPKIVKIFPTNDEIDHQSKAANDKVENGKASKEYIESKAAKSITFEDKTDSGVLDNNLSKQRAKIQVKRRPSSRRARHEAVRKSAIDFDDTDNSSSFDEPVKHIVKVKDSENTVKNRVEESSKENDHNEDKPIETNKSNGESEIKSSPNKILDINMPSNSDRTDNRIDNNNLENSSVQRDLDTESKLNQSVNEKTTTKVVYILNDEDIFNTGKEESDIFSKNILNRDNNKATKQQNNIFESNINDDDIFGTKTVESNSDDIFKTMGINTLGKSYEHETTEVVKDEDTVKLATAAVKTDLNTAIATVKKNNTATETVKTEKSNITKDKKSSQNVKSSLFSDSDEELFNKPKKLDKKVTLFDSDSEEDLFSGKKRTEKQSKEKKNQEVREKKEVKASLFGDDGDDDLFGDKKGMTETSQPKPSTSREATIASKSVEPVFEDPLSMFDD